MLGSITSPSIRRRLREKAAGVDAADARRRPQGAGVRLRHVLPLELDAARQRSYHSARAASSRRLERRAAGLVLAGRRQQRRVRRASRPRRRADVRVRPLVRRDHQPCIVCRSLHPLPHRTLRIRAPVVAPGETPPKKSKLIFKFFVQILNDQR
jgi:hypothetical protein